VDVPARTASSAYLTVDCAELIQTEYACTLAQPDVCVEMEEPSACMAELMAALSCTTG
jgi:hypothetical protein